MQNFKVLDRLRHCYSYILGDIVQGNRFFTIAIDTQVCSVFLEGGRVIATHHFIVQYLWTKFYN